MRRTSAALAAAATTILVGVIAVASEDAAVPYPQQYRAWKHLHSSLVGPRAGLFGSKPCEKPCTGGILHFYANDKAMDGLRSGRFKNGSVLANEFLEIYGNENGGGKEGPRRGVGVMVKDTSRYPATGGWGFATYGGDDKVDRMSVEQKKACFDCHNSRKDHDLVFSEYHER